MNLAHLLLRSASVHPSRPAIAVGPQVVHDYGGLAGRAAALARSLSADLALAPGDRLALFANNCAQYLEIMHAAWIAGLAVVPINAKLHPKEVAFILEDSGAAALFASAALAGELQPSLTNVPALRHAFQIGSRDYEALAVGEGRLAHDSAPNDLAWLFYTSGTIAICSR